LTEAVVAHEERTSLPSGTVTFLFTDIEGSTLLLERLRHEYADLLADHRTLLRAAFIEWNGFEVDTQGDSFFVAFKRATDALNCAVEIQRETAEHTWPGGVTVRVRMALHTGEPIVETGGYVGMDVHRAARIASAGHGGQIVVSATTRALVASELPHGVTLTDLGSHRLKDVRQEVELYQVEAPGLPSEFPPLRTLETGEEPPRPGESPFKGLEFFDEEDAHLFFGREELTAQLVDRIESSRFLALVGASGSGKSSVVRAGVVPQLRKSGGGNWRIATLTPSAKPLEALALAMTADVGVSETTAVLDALAADPRTLHLLGQRLIGDKRNKAERLLVVVDQFEELFTLCRDDAEREQFIANLLTAVSSDGPVSVLLTLRADFYDRLAGYELRRFVAENQEYIGPMSQAELRRAIEAPAEQGGWQFAPGLVDLILHDVGEEPGALPLLSHALLETWSRRRGSTMTLKAYSESGGVRGAIGRTADRVFHGEFNAQQRAIARSIFLRLTELGDGTQDTRRRVALDELAAGAGPAGEEPRRVLARLVEARLVTTSETSVEVAHEALIREWPTLRGWLSADRESLRLQRQITDAARDWNALGRDSGALFRGARLANALEWSTTNGGALNEEERAFVAASAAQQAAEEEQQRRSENEQRRLRRRARIQFVVITVVLVLFAGAVAYAVTLPQVTPLPTVALVRGEVSGVNDLVEAGFDRAVSVLPIVGRRILYDPSDEDEAQAVLRQLAADGTDLIIISDAVPDLDAVARAHPATRFSSEIPISRPNAITIAFAEQDGSFLAGAAAALKSKTNVIGFIGGVDFAEIWRFHAGFEAGARAAKPDIRVLAAYISEPPDFSGFIRPIDGRNAALEMYEAGADVIFHAAGRSGVGLFDAAATTARSGRDVWAIGVDSDQFVTVADAAGVVDPAPWQARILTSMVKRQDVPIMAILEPFSRGEFKPGLRTFGLESGAIEISYSGGFIDDIRPRLEEFRSMIVSGEIVVPCIPDEKVSAENPQTVAEGCSQSDEILPIEPGRHVVSLPAATGSIDFAFDVPAGWQGGSFVVSPLTGDQWDPPTGMALLFNRPIYLETDPCHWLGSSNDIAVGPSVDDLVDALVAHGGYTASTPTAATLSGYQGTRLDIHMPDAQTLDFSTCDESSYRIWGSDGGDIDALGPATTWHLWILDVGGDRVDVMVEDFPGTSAADRAMMQAVVDSIQISR
jgi:basic membrane lipoprotein Med (substrate-binding protein (PBP1-ABC) superfamily)/class 3 adenylate cyclase